VRQDVRQEFWRLFDEVDEDGGVDRNGPSANIVDESQRGSLVVDVCRLRFYPPVLPIACILE